MKRSNVVKTSKSENPRDVIVKDEEGGRREEEEGGGEKAL